MAPSSTIGLISAFRHGVGTATLVALFSAFSSHVYGEDGGSREEFLPTYTSSALRDDLQPSDRMHFGADAAPWLPQMLDVLKANRPRDWRLDSVALFDGAGGRRYVATFWGELHWTSRTTRVEFHRFAHDADGRARLYYYRTLTEDSVELNHTSGQGLFPGEAPVAVVGVLSMGTAAIGSSLRLIQMKRNTVDITPDAAGRLIDMRDLDGDGTYEAISVDDGWTGFFDTRGAAGPFLPVVSVRVDGRFVPACRSFRPYHAPWIEYEMRTARDEDEYVGSRAEALAQVMLTHAQTGAFDEARRTLDVLVALLNSEAARDLPGRQTAQEHFPDVLAKAERHTELPCPVSAAVIDVDRPSVGVPSGYLP